jgi:hypothetical protein
VTTMRWSAEGITEADCRSFVEQGADLLDASAGEADKTLVLANALRTYSAPSLLIGGTADPLWSKPPVGPNDQRVLELSGSDHALHRAGDWRGSLLALEATLAATEEFASAV